MKFAFYGLWEEEYPLLKDLQEKHGFEIAFQTSEVLSLNNAAISTNDKMQARFRACILLVIPCYYAWSYPDNAHIQSPNLTV